jgi:ubiquinone/menaquinone biosynthesis C-methylase UbiE
MPLGDASVDAITVGQAFHWFDAAAALVEAARVLRPGGALALVWNIRELADPVQERIEGFLREVRRGAPNEHEQPWREVVDASPLFGPGEKRSFPWKTAYTWAELSERLASVSFVAQLPESERAALLARVEDALEGEPEPLPFRYRTDVYVYPRL